MRVIDILSCQSNSKDMPHYDKEILLSHILKQQQIELYKNNLRVITPLQIKKYRKLINKYKNYYPIAYLVGHKEFMSLDFTVTPSVLIPRPETELLVETAIKHINTLTPNIDSHRTGKLTVFDIGTGSGNIAISIIKLLPTSKIRVFASDISSKALRVAKFNAKKHKVTRHIIFRHGYLYQPLKKTKADIIISNPPYVAKEEKPKWWSGLKNEPAVALWAPKNGLYYIEKIISQAPDSLKPKGWLFMEIGYKQSRATIKAAQKTGRFQNISILKDFNGIPRVFSARHEYNIRTYKY